MKGMKNKERQKNLFEDHAMEYDLWFDSEKGQHIFSRELDCLKQAIPVPVGRWLEVGVGSGRFAHAIGVGEGVDPSAGMVRIASERGIATSQACGEKLPLGDALFDGVLMVCTICFLKDPQKALCECNRILKNQGRMIIAFIPKNSLWGVYHSIRGEQGHAFYSYARFYRSDEIRAMAGKAGFSFRGEHACTLPDPCEMPVADDPLFQNLRDESFVVLSFVKSNEGAL